MKITCQQIEQDLDELLGGAFPLRLADEMHEHMRTCTSCKKKFDQEGRIITLLAQQKVPPMREDFAKQALAVARSRYEASVDARKNTDSHTNNGHRSFFAGFGYALATVAVAWIAINQFISINHNAEPLQIAINHNADPIQASINHNSDPIKTSIKHNADPIHTVSMSVGEVRNVHLVFNSPENMDNVMVAITLPEHTKIQGRSGVNKLSWGTSLKKGKNIISLPVIAEQDKNGEIITHISSGEKSKIFKVRLIINPRSSPIQDKAFFKIDSQHKGVLI